MNLCNIAPTSFMTLEQEYTVEFKSNRHPSVTVTHLMKFSFHHSTLEAVIWPKFRQLQLLSCTFWRCLASNSQRQCTARAKISHLLAECPILSENCHIWLTVNIGPLIIPMDARSPSRLQESPKAPEACSPSGQIGLQKAKCLITIRTSQVSGRNF